MMFLNKWTYDKFLFVEHKMVQESGTKDVDS